MEIYLYINYLLKCLKNKNKYLLYKQINKKIKIFELICPKY